MIGWLRRHWACWFTTATVPVRVGEGRVLQVRVPSDLAVHGWRIWRWTR